MKTLRIFEKYEPYRPIIIPINQIKYVKRGTDDRYVVDYVTPWNTVYIVFLDGECIDGYIPAKEQITTALEEEK